MVDVDFNSYEPYYFKLHNSYLLAFGQEKSNPNKFLYIWDLTKTDLFNTGIRKMIFPEQEPIGIYDNQVLYYHKYINRLISIDLLTGLSTEKGIKIKRKFFDKSYTSSLAFFENKVALRYSEDYYDSPKIIIYDYIAQKSIYSTSHIDLLHYKIGRYGGAYFLQGFFNNKYLIVGIGVNKKTVIIIWDLSDPQNNQPIFKGEITGKIASALLKDNFLLIKAKTATGEKSHFRAPLNLDTLTSVKLKIAFSDS